MAITLGAIALVIALLALAIALGTSLGRNGDREDEAVYRAQVDEALNPTGRPTEPPGTT